jgi:Ca2+-binding RTX toxin-like protein
MYSVNQTSMARRRARNSVVRAVESAFEPLESRRLYSVSASAAGGVLTVLGDNGNNAITVSRDLAGNLLVNNGAVAITGSPATVATITSIHVSGLDGNDNIALDETNGVLPAASISGGNGNDTVTGGSGADVLNGDAGNDVLFGKAGNDTLNGGDGNDSLTGGTGSDQVNGDAGNDRMIWNNGDGTDINEGGDGIDTTEVNGGTAGESFQANAVNGRVVFQRTTQVAFSINIGGGENLVLHAGDGDDSFRGSDGLANLTAFTIDGGAGNDTLLGTDGNDTILGGDGNDFIDGKKGNDVAFMGAGDDAFQWDPGEGSDVVEGQDGKDQLIFDGNNADENVDISAQKHGRVTFFRTPGNVDMDLNGVEDIQFFAQGGADNVTIHDLRHTDVTSVELDLGASDVATDSVLVEGTPHRDIVSVAGTSADGVTVGGLFSTVKITDSDSLDQLTLHTFNGNDIVDASQLSADAIRLAADGGNGNDLLVGGAGDDTLLGGNGHDTLLGGPGKDVLDGGNGYNVVIQ